MSKTENTNIAANALINDSFDVYKEVDVVALQESAIEQSKTAESSSRKETQMQLANILARYAQEKLLGDASPLKLYTVQPDGTHVFCVGVANLITRTVYDVPERDEDGKKQKLPQFLLARIRRISPAIYYCVTNRIPFVWNDRRKALAVPRWMTVADAAIEEAVWSTPEARVGLQDIVYLDGKQGRTLDSIVKRIEKTQKPVSRGTNNAEVLSNAAIQEQKLKSAMGNHGLEKTLELLADMFTKASEKPFADPIVELLAVCCEHVNVRNGKDALGRAVSDMSTSDKPAKRAKSAA